MEVATDSDDGGLKEEVSPFARKAHILDVIGNESWHLHQAASEILQGHGVQEVSTGRSRSKTRKSSDMKNGHLSSALQYVETNIEGSDVKVRVPLILKESCEFIRKNIQMEGIFRKSGSSSRRQAIFDRLISSSTTSVEESTFQPIDTVFDVASVLKQFLREMPQPLIPRNLHSLFVSCLGLSDQSTVAESILLAVFLLPLQNIHILCYLFQFLYDVAQNSDTNQMSAHNLAVVIAPNIMPVEEKKLAKGIHQQFERIALNNHTRVVEILIENGGLVGYINDKFEKVLLAGLSSNSSEPGTGRKKRRRSGSLTRVLGGIFWKVKNPKECETPATATATPGSDFKTPSTHTPIIRMGVRSKNDHALSSRRKKTILDSVRNHGLTGPSGTTTPSSFLACPSPVVCLDPSPFALNSNSNSNGNKQSPTVSEWNNFYTPELFGKSKRRSKGSTQESSNGKIKTTKLLFSRKSAKKQGTMDETEGQKLQKASSKISIRRLERSPRPRHGKLIEVTTKIVTDSDSPSPEPVLSPDDKNEAFLSSPLQTREIATANANCSPDTIIDDDDTTGRGRVCVDFPLLPWEIRTPEEPMPMDAEAEISEMERELELTSLGITGAAARLENVEQEFTKTLKESRIIELKSECKSKLNRKSSSQGGSGSCSFRENRLLSSPSQKRIVRSAARRRTCEVAGTGSPAVQTCVPRFMSLRSPKSRPSPPAIIARSPSRCTLQRGRPNTMRVGLARPSPTTTAGAGTHEIEQQFLPDTDIPMETVTLDRKGRVGIARRHTSRPALPQFQNIKIITPEKKTLKPKFEGQERERPRPMSTSSSYMAGKLRLGLGTNLNKNEEGTPGRAGRSFSMREDLFNSTQASPMRQYLLARSRQDSSIPRYRYQQALASTERENSPQKTQTLKKSPQSFAAVSGIPMRRQLSVQEMIHRIETGQNPQPLENENENYPPYPKKSPSKHQLRRKSTQSLHDVNLKYANTSTFRNPNISKSKSPALKIINHA